MGIVGTVTWGRDARNETLHYDCLFLFEAVGTGKVSFPKPVGFALRPVERGHCLSKLLYAIHPPAQFLGSILVNNSDLIFVAVIVRHLFSP